MAGLLGLVATVLYAARSVWLTDRNGILQTRAYIAVGFPKITQEGGVIVANVRIRNTGPTPARSMRFRLGFPPKEPATNLELVRDERHSVSELGAGRSMREKLSWVEFGTPEIFHAFWAGEPGWFYGTVEYTDVFGIVRYTWFKYRLWGEITSADESIVHVEVTQDGNHST
ncbi:MAG: hypothetical protein HY834_07620 [Devosia nanyangense]|uniref:Uncharacterized protein n=1 Tax=Devosia nanyangense TaxID=1228055 RepID=A0A933L2J0_9HYPH|nr:hypothetical protein [Devosia nanyangense]